MTRVTKLKALNVASTIISALLIVLSVVFLYIMFWPFTVLKDARMTSDKTSYTADQDIVLKIDLVKTMDVNGVSHRYLECKDNSGRFTRYSINQAIANRPTGTTVNSLTINVPDNIEPIPTTCHVYISIDYTVLTFRHVIENIQSNDFRVTAAIAPASKDNNPTQLQTLQQSGSATSAKPGNVATGSTTTQTMNNSMSMPFGAQTAPVDQNNTAPEDSPTSDQPSPGIIQSVINVIKEIL